MKTFLWNQVLCPDLVPFTASALWRLVSDSPRWSYGGLVQRSMSECLLPLTVVVDLDQVTACTMTEEARETAFAALIGAASERWVFLPSGKARGGFLLSSPEVVVSSSITLSGSPLDESHPVYQVMAPVVPVFSASSMVNRLMEIGEADGRDFVVVLDQVSGEVSLSFFASGDGFSILDLDLGDDLEVVAAFSTIE